MQKVNLYSNEFRPVRVILPLSQILGYAGALVLVLVLLGIWMGYEVDQLQAELEDIQNTLDESKETESVLEEQLEAQRLDESLIRHNDRLQNQIEAREQLLSLLDSAVIEDFPGFSPYLVGLARQVPTNLWLSRILVAENGAQLELEGFSQEADSVPEYLKVLQSEPVFVGMSFSVFDVYRDKEESNELQFTLQSKAAEQAQVIVANSMEDLSPAEKMVKRAAELNENE